MKTNSNIEGIRNWAEEIGRPVKIMEVCGTHTMAAFRSGLRSLLPETVSLISGPGCPVCVTTTGYMDMVMAIARQPRTIITTFGDMIRVPGSSCSLEYARAAGADVRVVYSPTEALRAAESNPEHTIVFLGVGFETTIPAVAWSIKEAALRQIKNFTVLCGHKTIPMAMAALIKGDLRIDGFMCPGHVGVVIGAKAFEPVCRESGVPCVVTGFEFHDMATGIAMILRQVAQKRAEVEIQYSRSVDMEGNTAAQEIIKEVFRECDSDWRGLGVIPGSGLCIRDEFGAHDAGKLYGGLHVAEPAENSGCVCGDVLRGLKTPFDCKLFGSACSPDKPVGPCMVSSEGTCAAYYKYAKKVKREQMARNA